MQCITQSGYTCEKSLWNIPSYQTNFSKSVDDVMWNSLLDFTLKDTGDCCEGSRWHHLPLVMLLCRQNALKGWPENGRWYVTKWVFSCLLCMFFLKLFLPGERTLAVWGWQHLIRTQWARKKKFTWVAGKMLGFDALLEDSPVWHSRFFWCLWSLPDLWTIIGQESPVLPFLLNLDIFVRTSHVSTLTGHLHTRAES